MGADASPPGPSTAEALPEERVAQIKQVMAGLTLAPPPPEWVSVVPEDVWLGKLIGRAGKRKGSDSAGKGPDSAGAGAANGSNEPKAP